MLRLSHAFALLSFGFVLSAATLNGGEALHLRVSPTVSTAPGFMTVQVKIDAAADDRLLHVTAESPDFYRSSEISLNGASAQRLNVFEFRNLPTGIYQVTVVLVGTRGPRATAVGLATVAPSPGR